MLPAGSLCHRVSIESPSMATTASGQRRPTDWAPVVSHALPSTYRPVAGGETIRGRQVIATATAVFEIRWLSQVALVSAETLRLKWLTGHPNQALAPIFEILKCEDPDGLREVLMIQAKQVKQ